jgi:hypothetical protein
LANGTENFILHAEGLHECLEGAKLIERADEIVEENDIAMLEMPSQSGQNKQRRAEQIRIQMDYQFPRKIVTTNKRRQRFLKKARLESTT